MKSLLLILSTFAIWHSSFASQPNIILIMVDDFGYECVTANGGESYQTPNIDKLAASGVRFENCHVQPLCTPTRVQLMTGRHNVRNYINFGTLLRTETTFGNLMKGAGYATGICGKWQLGHEVDSPQHFGFDESCLWQQTRRPPRYANPGLEYNGVEKDFTHGEYGPALVNDFALSFITKNKEKPFFLYYPMILTHNPFQPTPDSPDWDPTISSENKQQSPKHFAEMTAYMDKMVGSVVAKLEELGIRDNTLLLFLGDNGTNSGITSRFKGADYKGGKGSTTSHGTHVPLIVSWPAVMKQGRVSADLVSSTDFLPTLCAAAGVKVPEGTDGVSFLPQLKGEAGTPREWLYTWYSPRQSQDMTVREYTFDQRFKLYRTGQFYDLSTDELEKQDIAATTLSSEATAAKTKLQTALDQFKDARPIELDREFQSSGKGKAAKKARKKNKKE
ncbi:MAG: sulfatase-like hydrolase/transferase [Prosthecobacter sp.]|uniref:sulfatase-like hydrolase/transferase n=1 Tax=Prosthecobacter sp. TaxID=1965333 RepID=UPI003BB1453E